MSRYVTAIDIGTTKVITLVGEKTSAGIKIVAYSEAPVIGISRGEVVNIRTVLDSLLPTIEDVKKQLSNIQDAADYQIRDVYVGISGQNIRSFSKTLSRNRANQYQLIDEKEVLSMLNEMYNSKVEPTEEIYHIVPQSYNVDEQIGLSQIDGMEGKEIEGEYKLFVGRQNTIKQCKSVINRAGLNVKKFIFNPIATAEAILSEDEKELGCVLANIGGGCTEVIIYHDRVIRHAAVIPFAGNSITSDISQICQISTKNAEALKRQHGTCVSEYAPSKYVSIKDKNRRTSKEFPYKKLAEAIEARMCEILATVRYEIHQAGYADKVNRVILTGGTSNLNHIQALANVILEDMDIKLAQPSDDIITSNSVDAVFNTKASTAVGLIIKGFEYEDILPEDDGLPRDLFGEIDSSVSPNQLGSANSGSKKRQQTNGKKKTLSERLNNLFGADNDNEA